MTKSKYKELLRMRRSQELMFFILVGEMAAMGRTPRDVINLTKIPTKRAHYLLSKWACNGYYDYGTSLDLGWLTKKIMVLDTI